MQSSCEKLKKKLSSFLVHLCTYYKIKYYFNAFYNVYSSDDLIFGSSDLVIKKSLSKMRLRDLLRTLLDSFRTSFLFDILSLFVQVCRLIYLIDYGVGFFKVYKKKNTLTILKIVAITFSALFHRYLFELWIIVKNHGFISCKKYLQHDHRVCSTDLQNIQHAADTKRFFDIYLALTLFMSTWSWTIQWTLITESLVTTSTILPVIVSSYKDNCVCLW